MANARRKVVRYFPAGETQGIGCYFEALVNGTGAGLTEKKLPPDCIIIGKNGAFRREVTDLYTATTPIRRIGDLDFFELEPQSSFTGKRIPYGVFARGVSFMREVNDRRHTEARLDLWYNPVKKLYKLIPPLQRVQGARVDYNRDIPEVREMLGAGWLQCGSMHSHPGNMGAFQSGGDHDDETNNDGVHFTVSNFSADKVSIDCRLVANGHSFKIELSDVLDLDFVADVPQQWHERVTTVAPGAGRQVTPLFASHPAELGDGPKDADIPVKDLPPLEN